MAAFDYTRFPTLTIPRLVLRELRAGDAEALFAFRSDRYMQRYNSAPLESVAVAATMIDELARHYPAGADGSLVRPARA